MEEEHLRGSRLRLFLRDRGMEDDPCVQVLAQASRVIYAATDVLAHVGRVMVHAVPPSEGGGGGAGEQLRRVLEPRLRDPDRLTHECQNVHDHDQAGNTNFQHAFLYRAPSSRAAATGGAASSSTGAS